MKYGYFIKILLAFFLAFAPTQAFAKTIKWSMQGDSLTLDPCLLYTSPSPRDRG